MVKLNLTEKEAELVKSALDLYMRIGIGQFEYLFGHPQIKAFLDTNIETGETNYHSAQKKQEIESFLLQARNKLFNLTGNFESSYALGHPSIVDEIKESHELGKKIHNQIHTKIKFAHIKFGTVFKIPGQDLALYLKVSSVECVNIFDPKNKVEIDTGVDVEIVNEF